MANLNYTIDIEAPKQKVWQVMLELDTYKEWTGAFHPGSTYEGSWDKGSKIKFVSEDDRKLSGIFSQIAENIPYEYVSIEHLGEIVDGKEDMTSESAKQWSGSHENYRFTEKDGITTVDVELTGDNIGDEIRKMFDGMWLRSLQKLKEICER
ncbi:MAG TPA: SRPBCC domain-containing protein [Candidatus Saccharimonadales bacterium]|nr:SRPBCC domain-containing protein [Candidatus Saccharimonadales bacterium]